MRKIDKNDQREREREREGEGEGRERGRRRERETERGRRRGNREEGKPEENQGLYRWNRTLSVAFQAKKQQEFFVILCVCCVLCIANYLRF